MAFEILSLAFNSVFDLLRGAVVVAIPLFVLMIIGKFLRAKLAKKTKWKWITSAFAVTFAMLFAIMLILYFYPAITGLQESNVGEVPSVFAPSAASILISYIYGLLKVTLTSLFTAVILMPFEFIGLFIFESISKRFPKNPELVNLAATSYLAAVVGSAIILFIIPELINGLAYFLYFG